MCSSASCGTIPHPRSRPRGDPADTREGAAAIDGRGACRGEKRDARERRRYARTILPAFMHLVHTLTFLTVPSMTACTLWMFGLITRFVTRCEWLTLRPADGCFPQTEQTWDMRVTPSYVRTFCGRAGSLGRDGRVVGEA